MRREELIDRIQEKDLIAIQDSHEKVHIVWRDNKYGLRICRPSMIRIGTNSRVDKEWEILDRCYNYNEYETRVENLGRPVCKHCLEYISKHIE